MGLAEIEAELPNLSLAELRELALKSWNTYVQREASSMEAGDCTEDDPELLALLDEAIAQADATRGRGLTSDELRQRLSRWSTK